MGDGTVKILGYSDFIKTLLNAGFSMGGGNSEGVYSVIPWDWCEWHTGNPDTDPWEWRVRALNERRDIAYAKVFFKKSGYITREFYPYFLAVRRRGKTFEEGYADGIYSNYAKRIYEAVSGEGELAAHEIKQQAGFTKEEKAKFERGLVELQTGMYLTMCGAKCKVSQNGEEYGWSSMVFCTPERFFGEEILMEAAVISPDEAEDKIRGQILRVNPAADSKKIVRFIRG